MASQTQKLLDLLDDGHPHSTIEIMEKVYGGSHLGLARVGARIYDLKKNHTINGWKDEKHPTIYWYQLIKYNFNGVAIVKEKVYGS